MSSNIKITEKANFIQHHLPGLDDGSYVIGVQNVMSGTSADPANSGYNITAEEGTTTAVAYKFAVTGPRYKLDPAVVHSVFPPEAAMGDFHTVIPHIVLTQKTLPWQRTPGSEVIRGKMTVSNGKTSYYDADVPSWLAVLLLNEDDYPSSVQVAFKDAIQSGTVADLQGSTYGTGDLSSLSPLNISSAKPLAVGESEEDHCQLIQIPTAVFNFIAPSYQDLAMMANVRQVDVTNKPSDTISKVPIESATYTDPTTSVPDPTDMGTYSIVLGNRLPAPGKKHLAVLVSLEGMAKYLPDYPIAADQKTISTDIVLLPVLRQWTFVSLPETNYSFDGILENLNKQPGTGPQLKFYPSATVSDVDASNALNLGYVPLNHLTRVGKQTASWYRSPLAPVAVGTTVVEPTSSDQMQIYHPDKLLQLDPNTGIFNVTYAAAWQLGQLLALQDKSFSTLLYQKKQDLLHKLIDLIDEKKNLGSIDGVMSTLSTIYSSFITDASEQQNS